VDKISDEVLMAFADGVLAKDERLAVERCLAADPALNARLEPFVMTRTALPALFAEAVSGPVPQRLIDTMHSAPMAVIKKSTKASRWGQIFRHMANGAGETLFPSGLRLAHAFTLAALFAGGTAAGWLAAQSSGTQSQIAYNSGLMYATGALAETLEKTPSPPIDSKLANGSAMPVLTFATSDQHYCRQYQIATDLGQKFGGFACRDGKGAWHVVVHTALTGGKPGAGTTEHQTAAGPGAPVLEAAIDRVSDGSRVEAAEEAALIKKGWSAR
jgi:hypothetical protein